MASSHVSTVLALLFDISLVKITFTWTPEVFFSQEIMKTNDSIRQRQRRNEDEESLLNEISDSCVHLQVKLNSIRSVSDKVYVHILETDRAKGEISAQVI